jgi:hypothetical protein
MSKCNCMACMATKLGAMPYCNVEVELPGFVETRLNTHSHLLDHCEDGIDKCFDRIEELEKKLASLEKAHLTKACETCKGSGIVGNY